MANKKDSVDSFLLSVGLTEQDIYEAMKSIKGYLDITPKDFKELYCMAFQHAVERFGRSMSAKDIMVKEVISVMPQTPIADVAELMGTKGISGVPVLDSSRRVLGIISEKDFLSRMGPERPKNLMSLLASTFKAKACIMLPEGIARAEDIMSSPAVTVMEDMPLMDIARTLSDKTINRVPVTHQDGALRGIITRTDIVAATVRSWTCSWTI